MSNKHFDKHRGAAALFIAAATIFGTGCERVPDHCEGYTLACISVTVDSGPVDVRRLRINVMDGLDTSTVLTPKKPPAAPLVYPLRFGIRFGEFDNVFRGQVTFETFALNDDFDTIGQTSTVVMINGVEKKAVTISLGDPIPVEMPDLSNPPPDLLSVDLADPPDMP